MTKKQSRPRNTPIRKLQHYGMWLYCLRNCSSDGTFHKTSEEIHAALLPMADISARDIQRRLNELVESGHLIVTKARHQDKRGWNVPATYRVVREFLPNGFVRIHGDAGKVVKAVSHEV